jgi:hypothetical protein
MSSPLTPLHNALYTALDGVSGLTAYSFLPTSPSYPYAYIGRKESRPQGNKSKTRHAVRVQVILVTDTSNVNTLQGLVSSIETALVNGVTPSGDWAVRQFTDVPDADVFPAQHYDGSQGYVAELFYEYIIDSTA